MYSTTCRRGEEWRKGAFMKDLTETNGKVAGAWNQATAHLQVVGMDCVFEDSSRSAEERKKMGVGVSHIFLDIIRKNRLQTCFICKRKNK
jgi:hypothetical protein